MKRRRVDRREFIVETGALAVVAGAGLGGCSDDNGSRPDGPRADGGGDGPASCSATPEPLIPPRAPARVVEVHDPLSVSASAYDAARIKAMLAAGVQKLADTTDTAQAWKALIPDFAPSMRIGIKLNCLSNNLYNSNELVLAVIETLVTDLGADSQKIWVWDRRTDELIRSSLTQATLNVKAAGTVASTTDPSGPGYESKAECVIDKGTRVSRILTAETDITINIALLKTHNVSAITGALKNTYGCIDNPGEFHADFNHYLPALYRLDAIRKPFRLHITEGLKAVIKGDDPTAPADTLAGRLLLSQDPLALDSEAAKLVNALRATNPKLAQLSVEKLGWLDEAEKLGLGTRNTDLQQVTMP
jgi:uncharacterized protein (DUF362 family)